MLQKLLGSQARAEILKKLFTSEKRTMHLREFSRQAKLSAPVLQRELRQLTTLGIVIKQKDGNRVNYQANTDSLLYPVLCDLVLKTDGPVGFIQAALEDISAEFVFIFGSIAKGTANVNSDIDLFIIGDCGLLEVSRRVSGAACEFRQEINPFVITRDEFISRIQNHDHFLVEIRMSPKIFLKGDPDEFTRMAK